MNKKNKNMNKISTKMSGLFVMIVALSCVGTGAPGQGGLQQAASVMERSQSSAGPARHHTPGGSVSAQEKAAFVEWFSEKKLGGRKLPTEEKDRLQEYYFPTLGRALSPQDKAVLEEWFSEKNRSHASVGGSVSSTEEHVGAKDAPEYSQGEKIGYTAAGAAAGAGLGAGVAGSVMMTQAATAAAVGAKLGGTIGVGGGLPGIAAGAALGAAVGGAVGLGAGAIYHYGPSRDNPIRANITIPVWNATATRVEWITKR